MPRISDHILCSVFYLYESVEDAKTGARFGGTGFLFEYTCTVQAGNRIQGVHHCYAVTNKHVAIDGKASNIRLNTVDGRHEVLPFGPDEWAFVPGGDDVAVVPLDLDYQKHEFSAIAAHDCLRPPEHPHVAHQVGPGEDVFMVGRFIDHDGGATNQPAVRFGCLSIMPSLVKTEFSKEPREYFCVDMHSRTGFSGSPVFAYRTFGQDIDGGDVRRLYEKITQMERMPPWDFEPRLWLLGIQCGQFPEYWNVERTEESSKNAKEHIRGLSGMTLVSPAWKILECLQLPELETRRQRINEEVLHLLRKQELPPVILEDVSSGGAPSLGISDT